jgi:hypothetical protein
MRQSNPELALSSLIRQSRELEHASSGICHPKAYYCQDEILKEMTKLKSQEMGEYKTEEALMESLQSDGICLDGPKYQYFILIINNILG